MLIKRLKAACRLLWSVVTCVLASSGFRVDNLGWTSLVTLAFAAVGYWAHQTWFAGASAESSVVRVHGYFLALFVIRYVYLFASFVRGGIADRLIARFGEQNGYRIYEIGTAWMFFQRGLTFAPLIALHPWSLLHLFGLEGRSLTTMQAFCTGSGLVLVLVGTLVNVWSTLVVGIDVYYYKDLFLRRAVGTFEVRGPYRYLSNPMYGLGQCSGYGAALMLGSVEGLLATLVNQLCMYGFYYAIEKPHIRRVFAKRANEEADVSPIAAFAKKTAIAGPLVALLLLVPSEARGARDEQAPLATYAAIGVGAIAEGIVHAEAGPARMDVGLGETQVGLRWWREIVAQAGYQYGSNVFVGLKGESWSARVGMNPDARAWRLGVGFGAPLLPLPGVIEGAAARAYPRVEKALAGATLLDAMVAGLGPVTDALAAGAWCGPGVGIQVGFEPEGRGAYAFAGVGSSL